MPDESFKDIDTTKWVGKHTHTSVAISSNLVKEPFFLCNSDPHHLVTSFVGALENLAVQSKAIVKSLFFDKETTIKVKVGSILEKHALGHIRGEQAVWDEWDSETFSSTQSSQMQKKHLVDLQEDLERYCNVSPVFSFSSAKYDLNLKKILFVTHSC